MQAGQEPNEHTTGRKRQKAGHSIHDARHKRHKRHNGHNTRNNRHIIRHNGHKAGQNRRQDTTDTKQDAEDTT